MKKIIIIILIFVLLPTILGADVFNNNSLSFASSSSYSGKEGFQIYSKADATLKSITKSAASGATKCYVYNNSYSLLSSGNFTGNVCSVNQSITLGSYYKIEVDNAGGSYTRHYTLGSITYPIDNSDITWVNGSQGGTTYTTDGWDIYGVTTELTGTWSYNSTSYETATEYFNYTTNTSNAPTNVQFHYNGSIYSATANDVGGNFYNFISSLDIPLGTGTKNFYFSWVDGGTAFNSSSLSQTISQITFALCNASLTTKYLNLTFKDEVTKSRINASISSSTWNYYLGSGSVYKNYTYSNSPNNNTEYNFCFSPNSLRVFLNVNLQYDSSDYSTRNWVNLSSYSSLTHKTLYGLSNTDGVSMTFSVISATTGNPIENVYVSAFRDIEGETTLVNSKYTDGSGTASLFLNENIIHTVTFEKSGYSSLIELLFPSSSQVYYVYMGGNASSSTGWNQTEIFQYLKYSIYPEESFLMNNTNYTFKVITSYPSTITTTINISNNTGQQLYYDIGGGTDFSLNNSINTGNAEYIIGSFTFNNGNEVYTYEKIWSVGDYNPGDFSLWAFLSEWQIQSTGATIISWIKILIVLVSCIIIAVVMYGQTGSDVLDSASSAILGIILVFWIYSLAGWLTVDYFPFSWMDKYGIASIISLFGFGLVVWRVTSS